MSFRFRILFITSTSNLGGTERQLIYLAEGLKKANIEVRVISLQGNGELTKRLNSQGVEAINLREGDETSFLGMIGLKGWLQKRIQKFKPDIVHLFGLRADLLCRRMAKMNGCVVVSGIRSTDPWRKLHHVMLDRLTDRFVDLYISNSKAGAKCRVVREKISPSKIELVRNGIVLPDLTKKEELGTKFREKYKIPQKAYLLGMTGNYRPRKGHRFLLDVFYALAAKDQDVWLVFAGEDFMHGEIHREIEKSGYSDRILALPFQHDLSPLYAALDTFLLPSVYEGTPNSLMEAMAWEVPVMAAKISGVREILGKNETCGKLLKPNSRNEWSDAVTELKRNKSEIIKMATSGRIKIESDFSMKALVANHLQCYGRLLNLVDFG